MTEREAFEAWLITPPNRYPKPADGWTDLQKADDWTVWQASRKVALEDVAKKLEDSFNKRALAGIIRSMK